MAIATRNSALTTLQNAQTAAANGTPLDITEGGTVLVEISGTFTNITANFEASVDGTTWQSVSLLQLSSLTLARLAAATAVGLYRLEVATGLVSFRARTTVAGPTGAMTVKAVVNNAR